MRLASMPKIVAAASASVVVVSILSESVDAFSLRARSTSSRLLQVHHVRSTPLFNVEKGAGGMFDTRNPNELQHEDSRKSISAAPSFEEYMRMRNSASGAEASSSPASFNQTPPPAPAPTPAPFSTYAPPAYRYDPAPAFTYASPPAPAPAYTFTPAPPPPSPPAPAPAPAYAPHSDLGAGGMFDTRNPDELQHEDQRKSISAAPSFEEYMRSRSDGMAQQQQQQQQQLQQPQSPPPAPAPPVVAFAPPTPTPEPFAAFYTPPASAPTTSYYTPPAPAPAPAQSHSGMGAGGMFDTRNPNELQHEDSRKSISVAPSFEEYMRMRSSGGDVAAAAYAATSAPPPPAPAATTPPQSFYSAPPAPAPAPAFSFMPNNNNNYYNGAPAPSTTFAPAPSYFQKFEKKPEFLDSSRVITSSHGPAPAPVTVDTLADRYMSLEELEDDSSAATELYFQRDLTLDVGETDGPLFTEASGRWQLLNEGKALQMSLKRRFKAGHEKLESTDMGEFDFEVERQFNGEITLVGGRVAVAGSMHWIDDQLGDREVGYFNLIDTTHERN